MFAAAYITVTFMFACNSSENLPSVYEDLSVSGSFLVGFTTLTLVDPDRATPANGDFPGAPSRTVITEVWYPAITSGRGTALDVDDAPYPLVVLSHGFSGFRTVSTFFTEHLASHGYLVAAPDFPLTNLNAPGGPNSLDVLHQPGDVSLVIDHLLGFSATPGHLLEHGADKNAIGVAGHSLGGLTSLLVTFHSELADPRIDAAIPMAAVSCPFEEEFFRNRSIPLLLIGGEADLFIPFTTDPEASYRLAEPPKYLLNIFHGTHMGFTDMNLPDSAGIQFMELTTAESQVREEDWTNLMSTLGNPDNCGSWEERHFIEEGDEPEEFDPDRQRELVNLFSTAFFGIYLKNREEYRYFFSPGFADSVPDVRVESKQ